MVAACALVVRGAFAGEILVELGWAATTDGVNQEFNPVTATARGSLVYDSADTPGPDGFDVVAFAFRPASETQVPDIVCDPLSVCLVEAGDGGTYNPGNGALELQLRSGSSFLNYDPVLEGHYSNNNAYGDWTITVLAAGLIHADGFESGNLSAWQ